MKYAQSAAEHETERANEEDDVWIRYFKEKNTRFRFMPYEIEEKVNGKITVRTGCDAYPTMREHYHPAIKAFPCLAFRGMFCPGCEDKSEKVRDKRRKYYFPAIDEQGMVRIYKMGPGLWARFKAREERIGTLTDRDYVVSKSGAGLQTNYEIEPEEKYTIDFEEEFGDQEVPDIDELLGARYQAAIEWYSTAGDTDDVDNDGDSPAPRRALGRRNADADEPQEKAPLRRIGRKSVEPEPEPEAPRRIGKKAAARPPREEVVEEEEEPEEAPAPARTRKIAPARKAAAPAPKPASVTDLVYESVDDVEGAETEDLRAFLTQEGVEFPPRAPRTRLVAMALKAADIPPY